MKLSALDRNIPYIVYCDTGRRSSAAAYILVERGFDAYVLTGGLTRAAGENVGAYAIGQGTLAANSNYTINYTGANLVISQATLHVVADGKTKVYGDADPTLTFLATGFKNGDTTAILTGGLVRNAGENVGGGPVGGAYFITAGTLSAGGNYVINYTGNLFTITPAPLNVVADPKAKIYGDADPALTFVATGFRFSDAAATVLTGGLARAAGETVTGGPYAIVQGSLGRAERQHRRAGMLLVLGGGATAALIYASSEADLGKPLWHDVVVAPNLIPLQGASPWPPPYHRLPVPCARFCPRPPMPPPRRRSLSIALPRWAVRPSARPWSWAFWVYRRSSPQIRDF